MHFVSLSHLNVSCLARPSDESWSSSFLLQQNIAGQFLDKRTCLLYTFLRCIRYDGITLIVSVIVNIISNLMSVWRNIVHQFEELSHGGMFSRIIDVERQTSLIDCSSEKIIQLLLPSLSGPMCECNCSFRYRFRSTSLRSRPR